MVDLRPSLGMTWPMSCRPEPEPPLHLDLGVVLTDGVFRQLRQGIVAAGYPHAD